MTFHNVFIITFLSIVVSYVYISECPDRSQSMYLLLYKLQREGQIQNIKLQGGSGHQRRKNRYLCLSVCLSLSIFVKYFTSINSAFYFRVFICYQLQISKGRTVHNIQNIKLLGDSGRYQRKIKNFSVFLLFVSFHDFQLLHSYGQGRYRILS